jgi:hypothetical protein
MIVHPIVAAAQSDRTKRAIRPPKRLAGGRMRAVAFGPGIDFEEHA